MGKMPIPPTFFTLLLFYSFTFTLTSTCCLFLNKVDTLKSTIMKKKEEQLQNSLDRIKLQKHVYELCRIQKLTINEVRKKNRPWDGYYLPLSSYL